MAQGSLFASRQVCRSKRERKGRRLTPLEMTSWRRARYAETSWVGGERERTGKGKRARRVVPLPGVTREKPALRPPGWGSEKERTGKRKRARPFEAPFFSQGKQRKRVVPLRGVARDEKERGHGPSRLRVNESCPYKENRATATPGGGRLAGRFLWRGGLGRSRRLELRPVGPG